MMKDKTATPNGIIYSPSYPDRHDCPRCGRDWVNPGLPSLGMDTYYCAFPGCDWAGSTVDLALAELGLVPRAEPVEPPVVEWNVRVHYTYTVSAYQDVVVRANSKREACDEAEAQVEEDYIDGIEVDCDDCRVEYADARLVTPKEKAERERKAVAVTLSLPLGSDPTPLGGDA